MVVAESITIHKSQGSTLEKVSILMKKGMERSLVYVALSRATSLDGLFLIGEFHPPTPPKEDHPVVKEMKRLRESALLTPKFQHLRTVQQDNIQIVCFNVQSLGFHFKSIINDGVFINSHILLLQEIWLKASDKIDIPGMIEVQRNALESRTPRGTIIYAKNDQPATPKETFCFEHNNHRIEITSCMIFDVLLVNIYKKPNTSFEFFKDKINQIEHLFRHDNVIFCGDFNDNFANNEENNSTVKFLREAFNLRKVSQCSPTTNDGTSIDAVFAKLDNFSCETFIYESYFSHHKPIVIRLKRQ